jgi:hypothetical protein
MVKKQLSENFFTGKIIARVDMKNDIWTKEVAV